MLLRAGPCWPWRPGRTACSPVQVALISRTTGDKRSVACPAVCCRQWLRSSQSARGLKKHLPDCTSSPPCYINAGHLPVWAQSAHSLVSLVHHPSNPRTGWPTPVTGISRLPCATAGTQYCTKWGPIPGGAGHNGQRGLCGMWHVDGYLRSSGLLR